MSRGHSATAAAFPPQAPIATFKSRPFHAQHLYPVNIPNTIHNNFAPIALPSAYRTTQILAPELPIFPAPSQSLKSIHRGTIQPPNTREQNKKKRKGINGLSNTITPRLSSAKLLKHPQQAARSESRNGRRRRRWKCLWRTLVAEPES